MLPQPRREAGQRRIGIDYYANCKRAVSAAGEAAPAARAGGLQRLATIHLVLAY